MTGAPAFCCTLLGWDNSFVMTEDDEQMRVVCGIVVWVHSSEDGNI